MADENRSLELQIRIATQEALKAVSSLKGEVQALAKEANSFVGNGGNALEDSLKDAESAAKDAAQGIDKIVSSIGKLAEVAVLTKALSFIADMGAFALRTADDFQTMRNQFGILLGDMEAGAGLFNEIKAFNDKTPFDMSTLTQATNVLIAAKVPLSDLQAQLTRFGDLSQGNAQRMTSYVNAFSQAAAKGKADMQILNTYLNQGVPILDALAKNFGVTTAEIVEMSSQGQISFEAFSQALEDLTAAGGQYFGGMELASESLSAMIEGLQESANSLAASFGDILMPAALEVVGGFTSIINSINDNATAKGILAGAIVSVTAAMGIMAGQAAVLAAKTWLAYAAKMGLNTAMAITNPLLLAGIAAAGVATAGYVAYAASQQQAAREAENFALEQIRIRESTEAATRAIQAQADELAGAGRAAEGEELINLYRELDSIQRQAAESAEWVQIQARILIGILETPINFFTTHWSEGYASEIDKISAALTNMHTDLQRELMGNQDWHNALAEENVNKMIEALERAHMNDNTRSRITEINNRIGEILSETPSTSEALKTWQEWFEEIAGVDRTQFGESGARAAGLYLSGMEQVLLRDESIANALGVTFNLSDILRNQQNEIQNTITSLLGINPSEIDDPFELMDNSIQNLVREYQALERQIIQLDYINYLEDLQRQVDNLGKSQRELSLARLEGLGHTEDELQAVSDLFNQMERFNILESYRREVDLLTDSRQETARAALLAAGATQEELDELDYLFWQLRQIGKDEQSDELSWFDKVNADLKDFNNNLAESFSIALNEMEIFCEQAAVILGKLSASMAELSINAGLNGFEEFGRALGQGEKAADSLKQALAEMSLQILKQLPMMFLQAGLQLIANGQWAMGLGFIAASASSAIMSGYVDGVARNAHGGVYDEYGKAAREFAQGGTFTNQIVSQPTYFRFGGGFGSLGLMGEAGPEAIMPLRRMASGNLGVESNGGGGDVYVIIQNYTNEEVKTEESSDGNGNQIRKIIIGAVKESISSGEMDRPMANRYGLRAQGV